VTLIFFKKAKCALLRTCEEDVVMLNTVIMQEVDLNCGQEVQIHPLALHGCAE
jgi:hypothetical protein